MTETKIGVGILGFGGRGILQAALTNMNPAAALSAVYDIDDQVIEAMRGLGFSGCFHSDLEDFLATPGLEAVFLCTPNHTHGPLVEKLAERQLGIFVERPLAESYQTALQMVREAESSRITHALGYYAPFQRIFREGKRLLERNVLGRVVRVRASFYLTRDSSDGSEWLFDQARAGGGVVIASASDLLFLLRWYFGPVTSLFARASSQTGGGETGASIILDFESGLTGHADMSWERPGHPYPTTLVVVEGTGGMMEISDDHVKLYLHSAAGGFEKGWTTIDITDLPVTAGFDLAGEGNFEAGESFLRCCREKTRPVVTWAEGVDVQRTIEAVYRSIENNKVIILNEVDS